MMKLYQITQTTKFQSEPINRRASNIRRQMSNDQENEGIDTCHDEINPTNFDIQQDRYENVNNRRFSERSNAEIPSNVPEQIRQSRSSTTLTTYFGFHLTDVDITLPSYAEATTKIPEATL